MAGAEHFSPTTAHIHRRAGSTCAGVCNKNFPLPGHLKARVIITFCNSIPIRCMLSMCRVKPGAVKLETAHRAAEVDALHAPGHLLTVLGVSAQLGVVIPQARSCKPHLPACLLLPGPGCPALSPPSPPLFLRSQSFSHCLLAIALARVLPLGVYRDSCSPLLSGLMTCWAGQLGLCPRGMLLCIRGWINPPPPQPSYVYFPVVVPH